MAEPLPTFHLTTVIPTRRSVGVGMRGFKLRPLSPPKKVDESMLEKLRGAGTVRNVVGFKANIFEEVLNDHI